jgi:GNAT superfamily N-acetyltransferase
VVTVEIRWATASDLPALVDAMQQAEFFTDRLARQAMGNGVLLVAWLGRRPVGNVYLWLESAEERELREHLPDVPLITHLEVLPDHRNRRIGTSILEEAERLLRARGHARVALGVDVENHRAARLYERLGYCEWPYPTVRTSRDTFRVLVKALTTRAPERWSACGAGIPAAVNASSPHDPLSRWPRSAVPSRPAMLRHSVR